MYLSRTLLSLITLLVLTTTLPAQETVTIEGTILDAQTNDPVPGATIRTQDLKRGTYSSSSGRFRLPLSRGRHELSVSSIGYKATTVTVSTESPRVTVKLEPVPVELGGVEVTAKLDINDIVRQTIDRKEENIQKLRTFQGLLYSKFSIEVAGNAFGAIEDRDRLSILETFSRNYYDRDRGYRIKVIQRRQTANIPASDNLFALGNFFSFYEDDIPLLNATVMSPLSTDAFSRYAYTLRERTTLNGQTVYVIDVKPTTTLLPAFEGTMKIVQGTFDLVEVDLKPTAATAITFVRNLRFVQKFEKFREDIWQPTYLQVTGDAKVEIVKGFAEIAVDVSATSIFTEVQVNEPIPDSVYAEERIITAVPLADSTRPEFWENNALSELTERERSIYKKVDSLVAETDSARPVSRFAFDFGPYIDYNRVGSISLGGYVAPSVGPATLNLQGAYSFGLKKGLGEANLEVELLRARRLELSVRGGVFSRIASATTDETYSRFINSLTAIVLHRDYYDYYRSDGWSAGADFTFQGLTAKVGIENSRQFNLAMKADKSLASLVGDIAFRPNPSIFEGNYRVLRGDLLWGNPNAFAVISTGGSVDFDAGITAFTGTELGADMRFNAIEGTAILSLPTISTGYFPMLLKLGASAGTGDSSLPPQYQFRMRTSNSILGKFGQFYSAPTGFYGGTRYFTVSAEHNFSDIVWRWIGLPTYERRGIEFIVTGAAGKFEQSNIAGYASTGGEWYTEVGFGLGKIPLFITNVAFLRFDARWGIGPLGSGRFGAVLGLSSPF